MPIQHYRINNQISAPEVRVIGEEGENLGVLKREEALRLAQEKGLDLIEIAAIANPPVCRIISFDKFRYQKEKEERKARASQKLKEMKQIQITVRAALNDLQIKVAQTEKFLTDGHKIALVLVLRGREKGNKEWGFQKMREFIGMIKVPYIVTMAPKLGGRGILAQIDKK